MSTCCQHVRLDNIRRRLLGFAIIKKQCKLIPPPLSESFAFHIQQTIKSNILSARLFKNKLARTGIRLPAFNDFRLHVHPIPAVVFDQPRRS